MSLDPEAGGVQKSWLLDSIFFIPKLLHVDPTLDSDGFSHVDVCAVRLFVSCVHERPFSGEPSGFSTFAFLIE